MSERSAFLDRLRQRLAAGIPENHTHPLPAPGPVPSPCSTAVDPTDLVGSFATIATDAGCTVERILGPLPDDGRLAAFVAEHRIERAVTSAEPEAVAVGAVLRRLGVEVHPSDPERAAEADLGVTSAVALVAATGSLAVRSDVAGSRTVSLLPRVHLCVAPVDRVVAATADVFGRFHGGGAELPSNLVLITGPSRTGDIEQILTRGVHGPVAVHVVLTT